MQIKTCFVFERKANASFSDFVSSPILGAGAEGRGGEDSHGEYLEWQSIDQFGRTATATAAAAAAAATAADYPDSEYLQSKEKVSYKH